MADVAEPIQEERNKIHRVTYMFNHMLLFLTHWFDSAPFDLDGDGDFDPEDVEARPEDDNFVHRDYQRPASKVKGAPPKQNKPSTTAGAQTGDKQAAQALPATGESHEHRDHLPTCFGRDGDSDVNVMDPVKTKADGEAEEDLAMHDLAAGKGMPLFIVTECCLCLGLWLVFSLVNGGGDFLQTKAGLDSLSEGQTDLRFFGTECQDLRWQFWRWFTYQFTHVGIVHIVMNVFLNLILGLPLEKAEGHLRMFIVFNAGVFGGACANMLLDCHSVVVGCSGGCYSLIGIHTADLLMNWGQKKFRLQTLVFILILISGDVGFGAASLSGDDSVSHTAHVGGAAAGLLLGVLVGNNVRVTAREKCFYITAGVVSLFFTVFSLAWLFSRSTGPQSVVEAIGGEDGWCWTRQVANESFPERIIYCVKCATEECVRSFDNLRLSERVLWEECEKLGWWDHRI